MLIYKIFRADEWAALDRDGSTLGAPVDLADGFVHFSTGAQLAETAAKHFAGAEGLVLATVEADALGDALKWEPSRGGQLFPHLYRALRRDEVRAVRPLPIDAGGHIFPGDGRDAGLREGTAMGLIDRAGLAVLRRLDPETAHDLALRALAHPGLSRLIARPGPVTTPRVATRLAGIDLPNPVGLAAGFDKNAMALGPLSAAGFGFLEAGAVTPKPQQGNPRPRLFRLAGDRAVINRFGFNNDGAGAIAPRLAAGAAAVPVGLNLGANKDSEDRAADYVSVLRSCGPQVAFVTVNVSSPNTAGLRDLQGRAALWALLARVLDARAELPRQLPVFLKVAPDLDAAALEDIARVALDSSLDGIVATNTTTARPTGLRSRHRGEAGGLSGAPLFERSTRVLARLSDLTQGRIALIGVGGIADADQAYAKIRAGAGAVQLYSALVYGGLALVPQIVHGLDALLARDGFASVAEAVGTDRNRWLV